jgi:hypothetical protein
LIWQNLKTNLVRYYKFLGVLTAFLSAMSWVIEDKVVKNLESEIGGIDQFRWDLTVIHEFWTIKQQQIQQSIDQGRSYWRLGKLMGGPDGLQKFDEEVGRTMIVNDFKTDAMMAAINISELSKRFDGALGPQTRLDSLIKHTVKKYNEYAVEYNKIELGIENLEKVTKEEIEKIEVAKKLNVRFRDEYKKCGLAIMNEAETIKEKLELEKKKDESWVKLFRWLLGSTFGVMSLATILGAYFEARESHSKA